MLPGKEIPGTPQCELEPARSGAGPAADADVMALADWWVAVDANPDT
jgi:hypothetical protein